MPESSLADKLQLWKTLVEGMKARIEELAHLKDEQIELEAVVREIDALTTQEDLHTSRLRETTRKRQDAERRGGELKGRLQAGLWAVYGKRSPTMFEFGLRPLGTATRKKDEEPTAAPKAAAGASAA